MIILCLLKPFLCYLNFSITVLDERLKMFHLLISLKIKKKQISSLLNNAKVWRNAILLWVEIKNVTKNWHSVKMDEAQCWKTDNNFSSRVILFLCSKFQMIHWLMQSEQPMLIMVIYFKYMYINVQYMHVHSFFLSWLLKPSYIPVSSIWYYKL